MLAPCRLCRAGAVVTGLAFARRPGTVSESAHHVSACLLLRSQCGWKPCPGAEPFARQCRAARLPVFQEKPAKDLGSGHCVGQWPEPGEMAPEGLANRRRAVYNSSSIKLRGTR